jgi:hypothetical protein
MTRYLISFLLISSLIAGSCSTRKNKVDHNNIIPEKQLVTILTELFLTDGLLTLPKTNNLYSLSDTLAAHKDVLKMHGYTKEDMDKTLKYYYVKRSKDLIKIYDEVLGILSEMESRYEKEVNIQQTRISNLWKWENSYILPDLTGNDTANFVLKAPSQGAYYLTYTAVLAPADQSYKPRLTIYTCNPDSIETGRKNYLKTTEYFKDGQSHIYMMEIKVTEKSDYYIRGWFYGSESNHDLSRGNLRIEKISLTFAPGIP